MSSPKSPKMAESMASVVITSPQQKAEEEVCNTSSSTAAIVDQPSSIKRIEDFEFPPGYRFCPFDHELISYYLEKKIKNEDLPFNKIRDVELYKSSPDELTEKYQDLGEREWYFFTPRDRKYRNGTRPNRAAGSGYWKATGADKEVKYMGKPVGHRKALVFYEGRAPKGDKTNWIMHEYRVWSAAEEPPRNRQNDNDMRLDDWVLCRIYKKDDKYIKPPRRNEEPGVSTTLPNVSATMDDIDVREAIDDYNQRGISNAGLVNTYGDFLQPYNQNGIGANISYSTFNGQVHPNMVPPLSFGRPPFPAHVSRDYWEPNLSGVEHEDWGLPNLDNIDPSIHFDFSGTRYMDSIRNLDTHLPNNAHYLTNNVQPNLK